MGSYRIARRLSASAGVLEAYIGVDATNERPVVVKRLVSPWLREAPVFAHRFVMNPASERGVPGLPDWLEVGQARSSVWLVQALHEGESVRHVMNALAQHRGFIAPNEGLALVGAVASLLTQLHERRRAVVHGDICASTVLVTPEGEVMLLDAGVGASLTPSTTAGPPRAEAFSIAPEQFTEPSTPATDIFRLGLMLFELSVGHPLFAAADAVQAMVQCQRFMRLEPERIKQVPDPWHSLLLQMLTVDPRERPQAAEVEAVLQQAAAKAGWKSARADIARLFARACDTRHLLADLARGGTQELMLGPLSPPPQPEPSPIVVPQPEVEPGPTTGSFARLPPVPTPPPPSSGAPVLRPGVPVLQASPPASVPAPSAPMPSASPTAPALTPNAVVGRITTRKMTRGELEAAQQADAPPPPASPPPLTQAEDPKAPKDARIGDLLLEKQLITRAQLDEARAQVNVYGGSLADALSSTGAIDEDTIVTTLADLTRTPHTTSKKLGELSPPTEAMALVPLELARELDLVPLGLKGGTQLMVAMKDPMDAAALERLKAATGLRSIVAMRGGEVAIRKTRNRFYTGQVDERPDWLERSGNSPLPQRAPSSPAVSKVTAVEEAPPTVQGALLPPQNAWEYTASPPIAQAVAPATLDSPAGRMVRALLSLHGDKGQQALALADLAGALAARLGSPADEVERVRFAATAVCVANLVEGRPACDVPSIGSLSAALGEQGWNQFEPLLAAWLEWPSGVPEESGPRAVCIAFAFALHSGLPLPKGSALGGALVSFKTRFKLDQSVLDLLMRGLSGTP
jgi:serine/threonine protein kinase